MTHRIRIKIGIQLQKLKRRQSPLVKPMQIIEKYIKIYFMKIMKPLFNLGKIRDNSKCMESVVR